MNKNIMLGIIVLGSLVAGNAFGAGIVSGKTFDDCIDQYKELMRCFNRVPRKSTNEAAFFVAKQIPVPQAQIIYITNGIRRFIGEASGRMGAGLNQQYSNFVTSSQYRQLVSDFVNPEFLVRVACMQIEYGEEKPFTYKTSTITREHEVALGRNIIDPLIGTYQSPLTGTQNITFYSFLNGLMNFVAGVDPTHFRANEQIHYQEFADYLYAGLLSACEIAERELAPLK